MLEGGQLAEAAHLHFLLKPRTEMSWMKWVAGIKRSPSRVYDLKKCIKSAAKYNLSYVSFEGELMHIDKAKAILKVMYPEDDKVYRNPDTAIDGQLDTDSNNI